MQMGRSTPPLLPILPISNSIGGNLRLTVLINITGYGPLDLPVTPVYSGLVRECVRTREGALQLDGDLDGVLRPQQVEHRLQVVPDVSCNQSPDTDNTRHSRAFHFSF